MSKHSFNHMVSNNNTIQTVPWLSSFALTVSVLLAMWLKLPKLLKPFRIFCAASRCLLLAVVVITFLFTIVSSVGVIIGVRNALIIIRHGSFRS